MSDIFREVDEALQREKAEKLWREYGPTLMAAAVLLVLGTALGVAWRSWDHSRDETETAKLLTAIDADSPAAALEQIGQDSRNGVEAIALMSAAQAKLSEDDFAGAAALYKQAAQDRGTPRDLRDLSRILFVRISPDATSEQKHAVLEPVLSREASPFIWQARIEAALLAAAQSNYQEAAGYFDELDEAQATLPPSLADRARALRQLYAAQAAQEGKQDE